MENKEEKKPNVAKMILIWFVWFVFLLIIFWSLSDSWKENTEIQTTEDSSIPREYINALNKAKIYAEMNLSKKWIYKQLTSENWEWFTEEASQYAIDNLERDYKTNALNKAKVYQEMNMSKNKIFTQLTSEAWEQFTEEEAQYAIDNIE